MGKVTGTNRGGSAVSGSDEACDAAATTPSAGLTFIGTATTLIELGRFTLLTDPNFLHRGQRAYLGKGRSVASVHRAGPDPAELPPLDAVLLSHLHGDHFDRVARAELDRSAPVLTTPSAAGRLERWGFSAAGMRSWEEVVLDGGDESLTITSVPGVHARGALASLLPRHGHRPRACRGWSGAPDLHQRRHAGRPPPR